MNLVLEQAHTLLRSRQTEDRIRAVKHLRRLDASPEAQELLLRALNDRTNYVAALAAEALGEVAGLEVAAAMVERFLFLSEDGPKRDPGCHIRAHLAFAFGRLEYQGAADALRIGIRARQIEAVGGVPFDTAAHLRANCALALAQLRAPGALRDIALLLFDTGRNVVNAPFNAPLVTDEPRKAAAQSLARLADVAGLIPLALKLTYLEEETPAVLQECMQAVVELQDERALELLTPYLRHEDRHLAAYAAVMIAQTRAPEAPALLQEAIPHFTGDPLRAVILALTTLRSPESDALLRALAQDPRPEVRRIVSESVTS